MDEIDVKAFDCMTQHIKSFLEQSRYQKQADFGAPCADCKYAKECKFNWYAKMKPLFEQSNVAIELCLPEQQHK